MNADVPAFGPPRRSNTRTRRDAYMQFRKTSPCWSPPIPPRSIHVDGSLTSVPECHLMTSPWRERRARPTSGQRHARASKGPSPTSRLVHAGNDVVGLGSSRPWTFSPLTSLGQVARKPLVVDVSPVVAIAGRAARTLDPGQRPATSIAGQKTSPAGAPPTLQATDRAVGRSAYARLKVEPMPLLSSRQLRGRMRRAYSRL
jgi:hypothetical protein